MLNWIDRVDRRVGFIWKWITDSLFLNSEAGFTRGQLWFQRFVILSIYLFCITLWSFFVNYGRINWGVEDWIWEWRYSTIIKEALTQAQLPLHTSPPLSYDVARFFSIPDVPFSPQTLLLLFLDIGPNFLVNLLLMFSVGYLGCLVIKRYYRLSVFSFLVLALLFNLNGFITSHIAAGHTFFTGYFLLPFFVLLVLQLMEGKSSKIWFAQMGLVLFGVELVGTTHLFAICFLFLAVLLLIAKLDRPSIFKALLSTLVLNIYRLAPAAIAITSTIKPPFAGFTTLGDLITGLVWIIPPSKSRVGLPIAWWEFDMYIGIVGLVFILYFMLWPTINTKNKSAAPDRYRPLFITMLIFSVFSVGYLYAPINFLPIPLFNLIHVPSRFFILPLLFAMTIASIHFQSWLDRSSRSAWINFSLILLLLLLGHDLSQHARLWRVEYIFETFTSIPLDYSLHIANQTDVAYVIVVAISWIISIIALAYTIRKVLKRQKEVAV